MKMVWSVIKIIVVSRVGAIFNQSWSHFALYKNIFFPAQAEYSHSSADLRLKIFL